MGSTSATDHGMPAFNYTRCTLFLVVGTMMAGQAKMLEALGVYGGLWPLYGLTFLFVFGWAFQPQIMYLYRQRTGRREVPAGDSR